jgi:hypothetical protein
MQGVFECTAAADFFLKKPVLLSVQEHLQGTAAVSLTDLFYLHYYYSLGRSCL